MTHEQQQIIAEFQQIIRDLHELRRTYRNDLPEYHEKVRRMEELFDAANAIGITDQQMSAYSIAA